MRGGNKFSVGVAKLSADFKDAGNLQVGFVDGAKYADGTDVASVAYYNEYGTNRIPPRPFMRLTLANHGDQLARVVGKFMSSGVPVEKVLSFLGEFTVNKIKEEIVKLDDPPNAPSTVAKKGFNNPLIDTSTMARAVTWRVKK